MTEDYVAFQLRNTMRPSVLRFLGDESGATFYLQPDTSLLSSQMISSSGEPDVLELQFQDFLGWETIAFGSAPQLSLAPYSTSVTRARNGELRITIHDIDDFQGPIVLRAGNQQLILEWPGISTDI